MSDHGTAEHGTASSGGRLEIAAPGCVADDFNGEIVALNLDSGYYFSFGKLAAAVWRDLAAGHSVDAIVDNLATVDVELAEQARRLVADIIRHKLMRPASGAAAPSASLESLSLAVAGGAAIVLEIYDDMRDLVLADPVHDVDEQAGWPKRGD